MSEPKVERGAGVVSTTPAMSEPVAVLPLDAATYARSELHGEGVQWVEKNCYVDVWIELVHALGCDPRAMLGHTAALDCEDDQWTFFKPKHDELFDLYGIDVQELNVWRPLADHAATQVGAGKLISVEADAFFLPDTAGTDYRAQHTKTTIIINAFDRDARTLGYFHNASYHTLGGEDFASLFRIGAPADPTFMPFFAEIIRVDRLVMRSGGELRALAASLLKKHVARRPTANPVKRFAARVTGDVEQLRAQGLATYHAWAFANLRQLGAAMELLAQHLAWLGGHSDAIQSLAQVSEGAKTLIMKGARAVNGKRSLDANEMLSEMAVAWERAMEQLA
jgi:hypothetical protein